MKKSRLFVMATLICALILGMMSYSNVQAASVKLNKSSLTLTVGQSKTLKLKGVKKGQKIKWTSSKKSVAKVSSKGKVTAKKKGKTVISAKVKGKKYKCKVTVKNSKVGTETPKTNETPKATEKPIEYGNVTGNISYFYNKYQGNRPDTGARVILIPADGSAKNVDVKYFSLNYTLPTSTLEQSHLYIGQVDGTGNYTINHVAAGSYKVLMISKETSTGAWFDAYDDSLQDAPDSYYDSIVSSYYPDFLKKETALAFGKGIGYHKYNKTEITVYGNSTSTLSYDFGITYI